MTEPILRLVAKSGVEPLLKHLMEASETAFLRRDIESALTDLGVAVPSQVVDELVEARLLQQQGSGMAISRDGQRASLLIEALNGGDIERTYARLRQVNGLGSMYELVRQGMTTKFFESLMERPGFARLYVCSPWINPSDREASILRHASLQMERRSGRPPEVFVITRPPEHQPRGAEEGIRPFRDIGARVFLHSRLHSKLYIREPDANGGYLMAIVGSENLTRSNNLELGIQINSDGRLIDQLIAHFWELTTYTQEGDV